MDKRIGMNEWIKKMRRGYYVFLGCSLLLVLTGGYFAWKGVSFFMLPSADEEVVYLCSAFSIVATLVLVPVGLKLPFLTVVRRWVTGDSGKVMQRYYKSYVMRLGLLTVPVLACWGSLGLIPSDSAFYLLVISVCPCLLVYPGEDRVCHELGENDGGGK
ncbi:MAG: hypothetical protein K2N13_08595 [Paraprevotella sp.]|nr:hypothetical protein [Paraprevotella sp.]